MFMARNQITSSVTSEENKRIENRAAKEMLTKYELIRKAVLKYCNECDEHERGKSQRENNEETRENGTGYPSVEDFK